MSHICDRCKKEFKYKCHLQRHLLGKTKCKKASLNHIDQFYINKINSIEQNIEQINDTKEKIANRTEIVEKQVHELTKTVENLHKYECEYCSKQFSSDKSLTNHIKLGRCKGRTDNIFIYERELGIEVPEINNLKCRFCKEVFSSQQAQSKHIHNRCQKKIQYERDLEKRVLANRELATKTINNNIENQMNIYIQLPNLNAFGHENMDYITTKLLIRELTNLKNQNSDLSSVIDKFTKLIHANPAHPENHNVLFKSINSIDAQVYDGIGFSNQSISYITDQIVQKVEKTINKTCDDMAYKDITSELNEVLEEMGDIIHEAEEKCRQGHETRLLSRCRQAVKLALHSKKDQIAATQNLIDNKKY